MTLVHCPQLVWHAAGSLTHLRAPLSSDEYLSIDYDPSQYRDYRWRLCVHRSAPFEATVFLHGHPTLAEAKEAAARHVGDE